MYRKRVYQSIISTTWLDMLVVSCKEAAYPRAAKADLGNGHASIAELSEFHAM